MCTKCTRLYAKFEKKTGNRQTNCPFSTILVRLGLEPPRIRTSHMGQKSVWTWRSRWPTGGDPIRDNHGGVLLNSAATSVQQLSDHGMQMIQGQFPRLIDPGVQFKEFGEWRIVLHLMVCLYNYQTNKIRINHIRTGLFWDRRIPLLLQQYFLEYLLRGVLFPGDMQAASLCDIQSIHWTKVFPPYNLVQIVRVTRGENTNSTDACPLAFGSFLKQVNLGKI